MGWLMFHNIYTAVFPMTHGAHGNLVRFSGRCDRLTIRRDKHGFKILDGLDNKDNYTDIQKNIIIPKEL